MRRKWTDEEVQFLKFAYPNKDFTAREISLELNRPINSIYSKAKKLGLKTYKEKKIEGYKRCSKCKILFSLSCFSLNKNSKDGYWHMCKQCDTERFKKTTLVEKTTFMEKTTLVEKKCLKCKKIKPVNEFTKRLRNKDGLDSYCRECNKISKEKSKLKLLKERGW